jgi:DNA-binding MarR family transcriptional regulator
MNGGDLHKLGRRLTELGMAATTQPDDVPLTPGELAVIEDVLRHPDSTLREIQTRTGFAQSHVSTSVARLRSRGTLHTSPDPHDGRKLRVRVPADTMRMIMNRAHRDVDQVIADAVPEAGQAQRVLALLDELAGLLL